MPCRNSATPSFRSTIGWWPASCSRKAHEPGKGGAAVPHFDPQQLADWTGGRWTSPPAVPLTSFHFDSRQLQPGAVFVAVRTAQRDGHDFLAAAARAGAGAALVGKPDPAVALPQLVVADPVGAWHAIAREHRRRFAGPVVGISGSAGKTSTKDLLALLLGGPTAGVIATEGNFNNHLGVPLTLTRIDPQQHRLAVIEAGINLPGEMDALATMIEPDVAIITLVAAAHTEALGGIEGVAREKARLPAATRTSGVAVFSRETAEHAPFRELGVRRMEVERAEVVRPAEPPKDRVYFAITHRSDETAVALAYGPPPPRRFVFRRVSDGMAQNAVLAICAALWLGVTEQEIQSRLRDWRPAALRGEVREIDGRMFYLDCYNANPASMADALATFDAIAPVATPRLFVLGCMEELGPEAPAHHRALGRRLRLRDGDQLYVTGTWASAVVAGVEEQGRGRAQVRVVEDLEPVRAALHDWPGAVFVKGSRKYALERALEGVVGEVAHA
ncbi:MAG: UDP-N-acetylmuramoyl-tripeptide--D-alanyl-D-alanine ligase [Verrucomicrobia bacterium]|nr:UDP-N-acetylmuramoyl-tripeptide--D-alanyl-D-alanine ligase [Verrucomicrobiota bacterium]